MRPCVIALMISTRFGDRLLLTLIPWLRKLLIVADARLADALPDPVVRRANQLALDLTNGLIEAKKDVAVAIADQRRVGAQLRQEVANVAEWERRAAEALASGREDLVTEALARKADHEAVRLLLQGQATEQERIVAALKEKLRTLYDAIEEVKRKKMRLVGGAAADSARRSLRRLAISLEEVDAALVELGEHLAMLAPDRS